MSAISKIFFVLTFCAASSAQAVSDRQVIFFGGFQSTKDQIQSCYPDFLKVYEWGAGIAGVDEALAYINSPANRHKHYLIAGHSMGAIYANRVAMRALNPDRLTLVGLDGFSAPGEVHLRVKDSTCWRAKSPDATSMSYGTQRLEDCGRVRTYSKARQCTNGACLHFALVNTSTTVTYLNWLASGYRSCRPNRDWIKDAADYQQDSADRAAARAAAKKQQKP
jgi:hypothetical protein